MRITAGLKRLLFVLLIFWLSYSPVFAVYPQRIVSGIPSITEMLFALGLSNEVVGVTSNCNYPPEAAKKEKIGGYTLNLEKVVSLKPDMILMLEDAQKVDIVRFRAYGLPVYTINPHKVSDVMQSILMIGELTGKQKEAKKLTKNMARRIKKCQPRQDWRKPEVLMVVGLNPLIVAGRGTYLDDVLNCSGGENIMAGQNVPYPQINMEMLLKDDPEYIIIPAGTAKKENVYGDRRWQSLTAVKERRIVIIDDDLLSRPGPRVVDAIEEISGFINGQKIKK